MDPEHTSDREFVHSRRLAATPAAVFDAIADPVRLARWYGPAGFRSEFEQFEFRAGGGWRLTLIGPDGTRYANHNRFVEIDAPRRVVVEHRAERHHFLLTITLLADEGGTRVGWRQVFDDAAERDRVAPVVSAANEQNLDRLAAEAARFAGVPAELFDFWRGFVAVRGMADTSRFYEAFRFGDSAQLADELAQLVLAGRKRATAGLLWAFEAQSSQPPRPGDLSIMLGGAGLPLCVLETRAVEIVPFAEVTADFAAAEGEGEATLQSWRRDHTAFFGRECRRLGRSFDDTMPVVCERFELIHRA